MAGREPDAACAQQQQGFKQAVVDQVIEAAHQSQRNQRRLAEGYPSQACAEAQQNNADIFQSVVRQQALNVVLHQGVEAADKRGHRPQQQQAEAPPQRHGLPGQQRQDKEAKQPDLHHHAGEERRRRRIGPGMRLGYPAVQRDNSRQHAKSHQPEQPDRRPRPLFNEARRETRDLQRAVALPQQPAGGGQQQRSYAAQGKPQLAGLRAAGKKRAAQRHDLCHHHQGEQIAGDEGADRRRHQQIDQQAVNLHPCMSVPRHVIQADKKPRQGDSQ